MLCPLPRLCVIVVHVARGVVVFLFRDCVALTAAATGDPAAVGPGCVGPRVAVRAARDGEEAALEEEAPLSADAGVRDGHGQLRAGEPSVLCSWGSGRGTGIWHGKLGLAAAHVTELGRPCSSKRMLHSHIVYERCTRECIGRF